MPESQHDLSDETYFGEWKKNRMLLFLETASIPNGALEKRHRSKERRKYLSELLCSDAVTNRQMKSPVQSESNVNEMGCPTREKKRVIFSCCLI